MRWLHPGPQCVRGLERLLFNDIHKAKEEYDDIVTWAHRIAIVVPQTSVDKQSMKLHTTSRNLFALHEDMGLQR